MPQKLISLQLSKSAQCPLVLQPTSNLSLPPLPPVVFRSAYREIVYVYAPLHHSARNDAATAVVAAPAALLDGDFGAFGV